MNVSHRYNRLQFLLKPIPVFIGVNTEKLVKFIEMEGTYTFDSRAPSEIVARLSVRRGVSDGRSAQDPGRPPPAALKAGTWRPGPGPPGARSQGRVWVEVRKDVEGTGVHADQGPGGRSVPAESRPRAVLSAWRAAGWRLQGAKARSPGKEGQAGTGVSRRVTRSGGRGCPKAAVAPVDGKPAPRR